MIDWKEVAAMNNLSEEEFKTEVYTLASVVGVIDMKENNGDQLRFHYSDDESKILLTVQRVND